MQPKQPKINQKLLLRFAIGLFALAGLVLAFWWYKTRESDPTGFGQLKTAGWVAAIETVGDGSHALVFKDDGSILRQPGVEPSTKDKDIAWRPDGDYLFFASNRLKGKFTIFRWFPDGSSVPEVRSVVGLPQGTPYLLASDADKHVTATGLVTAGRRVMEYDPKRPALSQLLPPPDLRRTFTSEAEGGGTSSRYDTAYERLGTSFRIAKWAPDKSGIFAVMRRDTGEILLYQKIAVNGADPGPPLTIVAGDKVDLDIDQNSGAVFFAVQNFQWPDLNSVPPEFVKKGRATVPYKHAVILLDLSKANARQILLASNDDKECYASPSVTLTGDKLAIVHGVYAGNGNITSNGVLVLGLAGEMKGKAMPVEGEDYEPSWSPDGRQLAFARRESSASRPIYVLGEGGTAPRRLSPDTGVFGFPVFSPQP